MNFATVALKYASHGLHVFPLSPGKKVPVIPGKARGGKGRGVWDATTDVEQLKTWGIEYPNAGIGLHPGPSGLVALDFDTKGDDGVYDSHPNGMDTLEELRQSIPEIDNAWIQSSPTGGKHYLFSTPEGVELKNPVRIMRGLDIRHSGTYIVVAPSIHPNGLPYKWEKREGSRPPVLPPLLVEKLQAARKVKDVEMKAAMTNGEPIHERHSTLMAIGGKYRRDGLGLDEISALLAAVNKNRCVPPLSDSEIVRMSEGLCTYETVDDVIGSARNARPQLPAKKLTFTNYSNIEKVDIDWIMPGYIAAGKFNLFWGLEGKGKSYITLEIASRISRGIALPGASKPEAPGSVLMFAYEDDPNDTIRGRLEKCHADLSRVFTIHPKDGTFTHKDVDALEATMDEIPDLRAIIIDPLTSFAAGLNDNAEGDVRSAMQPIIRLMMARKVALIGVKHANKDSKAAVTDRTAGSRAWTAYARSAVLIGWDNQMEQGNFHTYGGMVNTKGNLSGRYPPYRWEIKDGEFIIGSADMSLTPDRLFPIPQKRGEATQ